ncbi:MAG TPA: DUF6503 family protein [Acidobacteriota bacterium]|nr:DUF6503 family protein [Acidobacteriota bacterium]
MMRIEERWWVLWLFCLAAACGQQPQQGEDAAQAASERSPAEELVARSIAYHDPQGVWRKKPVRLGFTLSMAGDGSTRSGQILIDHAHDLFEAQLERGGHHIYYRVEGQDVVVKVDGHEEINPEVRRQLGLDREGGLGIRNYYTFLYELPSNLDTPGTRIHPEVRETEFAGREALEVTVRYDPEVGNDEWHLYFDPDTAALIGSRFQHGDDPSSGEYIIYSGEVHAGGLRRPKSSEWHMTSDGRLLGTDTIESVEVEER